MGCEGVIEPPTFMRIQRVEIREENYASELQTHRPNDRYGPAKFFHLLVGVLPDDLSILEAPRELDR